MNNGAGPSVRARPIEQSYRVRLDYFALCLVLGLPPLLFGLLLVLGVSAGKDIGASPLIVVIAPVLGAFWVALPFSARLVVDHDWVECRTILGTRRLKFSDIAGRKQTRPYKGYRTLILVPCDPSLREVRIPNILRFDEGFVSWFESLPDLDVKERQETLAAVLVDKRYGSDADARRDYLTSSREIAFAFNATAVVLLVWGFIFPHPYALVLILAMSLPVIAVLLAGTSDGMFRLEGFQGDGRPHVMFLTLAPAFILPRLGFYEVDIESYADSWLLFLVLTVTFAVGLFYLFRLAQGKFPSAVVKTSTVVLFVTLYSFGMVMIADTSLDVWPEQVFQVRVLDMHTYNGYRASNYYLRLSPWGPRHAPADVQVSFPVYSSTFVGDTRCVDAHHGALYVRWFQISECQDSAR